MPYLKKLLPLLALSACPALAAACPDTTDMATAQLAQITQKTPLYAETTKAGEPCQRTGSCGSSGYLLKGDPVVLYAQKAGWACIEFTSRQGQPTFQRAVPQKALKVIAQPNTLRGTWQYGDQSIYLRRNGDQLLVRGWSQWPWLLGASAETKKRLALSGPNMGSLDMAAPLPDSDTIKFSSGADENACKVSLRVLGPYLLAQDNNNCGGFNVTFSGTYRQTSPGVNEKAWQSVQMP